MQPKRRHSEPCDRFREEAIEFAKEHPDHCKRCLGRGYSLSSGTRLDPPELLECVCVGDGKCPLCSSPLAWHEGVRFDFFTCENCGWDDRRSDNPVGFEFECDCFEG